MAAPAANVRAFPATTRLRSPWVGHASVVPRTSPTPKHQSRDAARRRASSEAAAPLLRPTLPDQRFGPFS